MRRESGEITVFFSLILLVILALIGTSLESARAAGLSYRLRLAADSSLQSVFAQYDRILWENYGLLFFAGADAEGTELSELVLEYAGENADGGEDSSGADWFSFTPEGAVVTALVLATDQNGQVFHQAAVDYMRNCGLAEAAVETLLSLGVTDESGLLTALGVEVTEQAENEELDLDSVLEEYEELMEDLEEQTTQEEEEESGEEETDDDGEAEEDTSGEDGNETDSAEAAEAKSLVDSAVETVRSILSYGLLAFVLEDPTSVSSESLGGEDLPSSLSEAERSSSVGTLDAESVTDQLIFYEYIIRQFDAYTSEDGDGCQVEYILIGEDSDQENLSAVATELLWIREGLNLAYLLTDTEKVETAAALAALIAGWTGISALVEAAKVLILTVWALGESVSDVRTLLAGGKVPLYKTKDTWQLSLEGVAELSRGGGPSDEESGLSYEDYLRVLLLIGDEEEITYRCMDAVQREVCESESSFRMQNCVYAAQVELTASASYLFPYLSSSEGYLFLRTAEYSYGEAELD